jgi:hypothetical protein
MSSYLLDSGSIEQIEQRLPGLQELQRVTVRFAPGFVAIGCRPDSGLPVAGVCLDDAVRAISWTRFALMEARCYLVWYRDRHHPPRLIEAAAFARFYADDAALRLYSAGEHLANAILNILSIDSATFNPSKKQFTSIQGRLARHLKAKFPGQPITESVLSLSKDREWLRAVNYRNKWVHQQPPTMADLGMVYERRNPWTGEPGGPRVLPIGGGDKPSTTIDSLLVTLEAANSRFVKVLYEVVAQFVEHVENESTGLKVRLRPRLVP